MTPSSPMAVRRVAGIPLALAALAMPMSAVHAEANPYYAGVSVGIGHLTNITLAPPGQQQPDVYTSYGLVGGFDQPIGRQRLYASGSVTANKFQDISKYDNTSYNLNGGLDWSSIERLSGSVNVGLQQRLEYTGGLNTQQTSDKNIARTGQFSTRVQYGLAELMAIEGSLSHREVRYSAPAYANSRLKQDAASLGIRRRLGGQLDLGAALRLTHGSYPIYTFNRRDLDLTANWVATGASTLNARLSFGKQDNSAVVDDFSGATGQVQWTYVPTGKLRFVTTLRRDTGGESGIVTLRNALDPTQEINTPSESTRLTTTVALGASYEFTAKIRFNASISQARRSLQRTSVIFGDASGKDTTTLSSLGASYAPTRNWQIACDVGRQSRTADLAVSYPYGNTSGSCTVQYVIQ